MTEIKPMRERIIDAGVELARQGIHTVTVKDTAARAGTSRQTVYALFPDGVKELQEVVAQRGVERGDAAIITRLKLDKHPAVASLD